MVSFLNACFSLIGLMSMIPFASSSLKKCIQPIRKRIWDPHCYEAEVPRTIPAAAKSMTEFRNDYLSSSCLEQNSHDASKQQVIQTTVPSTTSDRKDACEFVAEAILADMSLFDMVLLNQGTCGENVDIAEGLFDHTHAAELLPYQNELIALQLSGKDIKIAIERGIQYSLYFDGMGSYPKTAGIKYDLNYYSQESRAPSTTTTITTTTSAAEKNTKRLQVVRVSNARILRSNCEYEQLNDDEYYMVLTNSYLAEGNDGYSVFKLKSKFKVPTGVSETDSFWFHTQSTCLLESPWKTVEDLEIEQMNEPTKMIYLVDPHLGAVNITTSYLS